MAETAVAPAAPASAPAAAPKVAETAPKVEQTIDGARSQGNKAAPVKDAPAPVKPEAKAPYKKFELDLNGKKVERVYNSDEEIARDIQKVLGLEEKMSTHAQKVEAAEQLLGLLSSDDPVAWKKFAKQCKANGIDAKKFATEILYDDIEYQKLTPDQQELRRYKEQEEEAKAEQAAKDAEAAKAKDAEAEKEREVKAAEWAKKFEKECSDVLTSKKLPATKLSLSLIAHYMDAGLAQKKEYTLEQIIPYVQRDLQHLQKQTFDSLDGQALLDYLGPELIDKITEAKISRYKKTGAVPPAPKKPLVNARVAGKTIREQMREKPLDSDFGDQY